MQEQATKQSNLMKLFLAATVIKNLDLQHIKQSEFLQQSP